jgi:hypothetical protein
MHPSWHVKRLIIYIKNRTRCLHHLNRFILQSVNNKFQSDDKITWRQNGFELVQAAWILNNKYVYSVKIISSVLIDKIKKKKAMIRSLRYHADLMYFN